MKGVLAISILLLGLAIRLGTVQLVLRLPTTQIARLHRRWNWPLFFTFEVLVLTSVLVTFSLAFAHWSISELLVIVAAVLILYSLLIALPVILCQVYIRRKSGAVGLSRHEVFRWELFCSLASLFGLREFNRDVLGRTKEPASGTDLTHREF